MLNRLPDLGYLSLHCLDSRSGQFDAGYFYRGPARARSAVRITPEEFGAQLAGREANFTAAEKPGRACARPTIGKISGFGNTLTPPKVRGEVNGCCIA